jgi:hypothetical protein
MHETINFSLIKTRIRRNWSAVYVLIYVTSLTSRIFEVGGGNSSKKFVSIFTSIIIHPVSFLSKYSGVHIT